MAGSAGGEEATCLHLVTLVGGVAAARRLGASRHRARRSFVRSTRLEHGGGCWSLPCAAHVGAGIAWYYLSSGIISVATLLLITWLLVRLSLGSSSHPAPWVASLASLVMDEIGAFGAIEREISLLRVVGVLLVAAGVVVRREPRSKIETTRRFWHAGVHGESGRCYWSSQWNWVRAGGAFRA
ncbi:MAG: DMT family transporter [Dehalococcoidia bacterium]|nr:DMT family transporter [Dehalococcoidia bacterium]